MPNSWDFRDSDTLSMTHGFHTYPAKMIPQVATKALEDFAPKAKVMFDPYCGTGTTLVEANLRGVNAIGCDLNPLARLISKVKTTPIELQTLELHIHEFYDYLFQYRFNKIVYNTIAQPTFSRIDFWFSKPVKERLSVIKEFVDRIENQAIADFFRVALSQAIRECSWTRNNEFKLYKMSTEQIKRFKPDAFAVFEQVLGRNYEGLKEYMLAKRSSAKTRVLDMNSTVGIPKTKVHPLSVDIVLTSPPYGDSSTTVAYGQFSALSNQWLGFLENGRALDSQLMGGRPSQSRVAFTSDALNDNIASVRAKDPKRAMDVVAFYADYHASIRNVSKLVRRKGLVCYVVSNRRVRDVTMDTDVITRDFFEAESFNHVATLSRNISSKRMPRSNSPNGRPHGKAPLMNTESIVVLQKR